MVVDGYRDIERSGAKYVADQEGSMTMMALKSNLGKIEAR